MRIALVTRFAWPHVGGTEVLVRTAANALAAHNHVEVFAHRVDNDGVKWIGRMDRSEQFGSLTDPESGVRTTQLRMLPSDVALLAPYLVGPMRVGSRVRLLDRVSMWLELWHARVAGRRFAATLDGADVIHRFTGNRMALATVRAGRRLGRPVVVTPLAHPGQWDDDAISAVAYREADVVVATSPADAAAYANLGVGAERLRICPLPTRAPVRGGGAQLMRSGAVTGPLVLFLGARRPYKGAHTLVDAASILMREHPSVQVAFVGPGPRLPMSVPANVLDVGEVDDDQRDAWLDIADIVCVPSSFESWGLVISEAWSVGAPVVTSDIPILRQRVENVGGGLSVRPAPQELADALSTLLSDDRMREGMGRAGYLHYVRELSVAAFTARHEEIYRELLSESPAPPHR